MSEPTTYGGLAHRPDAPAPDPRWVMSEPTKCAGLAHHQTAAKRDPVPDRRVQDDAGRRPTLSFDGPGVRHLRHLMNPALIGETP